MNRRTFLKSAAAALAFAQFRKNKSLESKPVAAINLDKAAGIDCTSISCSDVRTTYGIYDIDAGFVYCSALTPQEVLGIYNENNKRQKLLLPYL